MILPNLVHAHRHGDNCWLTIAAGYEDIYYGVTEEPDPERLKRKLGNQVVYLIEPAPDLPGFQRVTTWWGYRDADGCWQLLEQLTENVEPVGQIDYPKDSTIWMGVSPPD